MIRPALIPAALIPLTLIPLTLVLARAPAQEGAAAPDAAVVEVRDVASLLAPLRERHGLPGLAAAIVTTDGLIAVGAVGLRSAEADIAITSDDLWHLGSCTKAMTATLAARLVERRLLSWETTVGEVFGDLGDGMDPGWREVPLRLLLANRGGAPAGLDANGLWLRLHRGTPREQRRTLVEGVLRAPPEVRPDTQYLYSNAGFALAGAMLETVADEPWEQLLRREVFEPLGMERAGFGVPGTPGALDQPLGHRRGKQRLHPVEPGPLADNPAALGPAGTVHSSLADWARFVAAHLRGAQGQEGFLESASWGALHASPEGQQYALGWALAERSWAGGTALAHSGSNTMWYCTAWLAPARGFGVLAATNLGGDGAAKACDEVCTALVADWLERGEQR